MSKRREHKLARLSDQFRVRPGRTVDLPRDFDPGFTGGVEGKRHARKELSRAISLIAERQQRLAAEQSDAVLVILQAIDAGGKDGAIRHVMSGLNPQGVSVHSFKQPSLEEVGHDFLWRYQRRLPSRGEITVFNRSQYEEVLVVRVHPEDLDDEAVSRDRRPGVWKRRFREINDWERYLADNRVRIVKLLLHLSKEEQRYRFLRRCDLPEKHWKFSAADIRERRHWDDYQVAFSDMLSHTSTPWAPWYVIPADHKWYARLGVASALLRALVEIDPQFPVVEETAMRELLAARAELEAQAPSGRPADPVPGR
ncbi:MAG: hypothetical protein JOZ07_19725 [Solirubrobacterales bacterium]|nr:hypothetical protein [Solirubrobacterales bacterium]